MRRARVAQLLAGLSLLADGVAGMLPK